MLAKVLVAVIKHSQTMTQKTRRRGCFANPEGLQKLDKRMRQKGYTQETLAEAAQVNLDQVKRLLNPHWQKRIQKDAIEKIARVLDLDPTDIVDSSEWFPSFPGTVQEQTNIKGREAYHVMLERQHENQRENLGEFRPGKLDDLQEINENSLEMKTTTKLPEALKNRLWELTCLNEDTRHAAIENFREFGENSPEALKSVIFYLIEQLHISKDEEALHATAHSLGLITNNQLEKLIAAETLIELIENSEDAEIISSSADSIGDICPATPQAIDALSKLLTRRDYYNVEPVLWALGQLSYLYPKEVIAIIDWSGFEPEFQIKFFEEYELGTEAFDYLVEFLEEGCYEAAQSLETIAKGNKRVSDALIELLRTSNDYEALEIAADSLNKILTTDLMPSVITALNHGILSQFKEDDRHFEERSKYCYDIIKHCEARMSPEDFCQAWNNQSSTNPPEASDTINISDCCTIEALENQITDIASQLKPADKTYPIFINAHALKGETDTSAIAQELCNQIYLTVFPDHPEIPGVNNAPQLKRSLPQIKKHLQKQNLALILDKCQPNQTLITFCRKLTDVLNIAWITDQPLEQPLKGFPPDQQNLV
ncbi:MAG: helix-turn-helix transcriptional regulator, partial [Cyanobacteriota bacterium]